MAALLHCIVVDIENSRLKDHIRDWNTNMKVDMYNQMKEKLEKKEEYIINLRRSVWEASEEEEYRRIQICECCELFFCAENDGVLVRGKYNEDGYYCELCIEKNPDLEFSDDEEE